MGVAKFISEDPSVLSDMVGELYDVLDEMDGVLEWVVHLDGAVTVEYDHNRISEKMIEQSLSEVGLRLRLITGDPNVPNFEAPQALNQESDRSAFADSAKV